jgi:2,4-diaminopentanoate dehydrogenase
VMLRIVQWATGAVGRYAIAAIREHPEMELVGALVYSDDKAGRDAGEIAGIGRIGVRATKDRDAILALDADCVLYAPHGEMYPEGAVADICAILASGKNVVSTALTALIYPRRAGQEVVDRIEAACRKGRSSFHGTGIEPGWAGEVLPLTMSGLFRRIDSILVRELMDYSKYDSRSMLIDMMGFGQAPDAPVPFANPALAGAPFKAPLLLVADGLGALVEDFVFTREVAIAKESFEIRAGRIEAGTVSAQRFTYSAVVDGRPAITIEHITRLRQDEALDWPNGRGWTVTIEGSPSMSLVSQIGIHDEDENDQGVLGTAMHAVHAIPHVCAASPGIKTFLDLPLITGRHTLRRR